MRTPVCARRRELLGVRRAAQIGAAEPVVAIAAGPGAGPDDAQDNVVVRLDLLDGITQLAVSDSRPALRWLARCTAVVVENPQAAEAAAARWPQVAVLWVAGV